MKKVAAIGVLLVCSALSTQGLAEDKMKMQQQGQMSAEKMDKRMRSKQEHMLTMHDYANRILGEKNTKKKQKLKDEQLELMKAHHMKKMAHHKKMMK